MTASQPFNQIRRSTILADDAEDNAGTSLTTGHNQRVTDARPHHSTLSAAGVVIIASVNVRVFKSLAGAVSGVTG